MRILLTGGTGFIGSKVLEELNNKKNDILILTRKSIKNRTNIQFYKCDFFNPNSYIHKIRDFNPNIVVHCFWYGIPDLGKKNSNLNYKYSKIFFSNILNLGNLEKILVSGSCFEIKNKKGKKNENCRVDTNTFFSNSKIKIYNYLKKNIKKKHKLYWLRIFYAYGPKQRKDSLIPYIIDCLKKNKKINIKNPNNCLDFIFVKDIAKYFKKIIELSPTSGIYNVGTGYSVKILKIFKILKKYINKNYKYDLTSKSKYNVYFFCNNKKTLKNIFFKLKFKIEKGLKETLKFK